MLKTAVLVNINRGTVPAVAVAVLHIHKDFTGGIGGGVLFAAGAIVIGQVDARTGPVLVTVVAVHDFGTVVIPKLGI